MRMRWNQTIAGSAVVLMALAGCAGNDSDQQSEAASGTDSSSGAPSKAPSKPAPPEPSGEPDQPVSDEEDFDTPASEQPPGESGMPKQQVDASALPKGYPRKFVLNKAGDTLTVTAQESGCGKASAEVAEQTSAKVVVVLVHTVPKEERMCTMDVRYPQLQVKLGKPLGDRTLVLKAEERKK